MLISEEYRKLNNRLHSSNEHYGTSGRKFVKYAENLCKNYQTNEILDYGCGKATLATALNGTYLVQHYDPAIEIYAKSPTPTDIVICTDVMEHIEPECLDDVLQDIRRCMKKAGLITISTRAAKKFLEDGRNAHLIQEGYRWWLPKIWKHFEIRELYNTRSFYELVLVVEPIDNRPN